MDTTSFFTGIAPGAITVVTNLVTLLATVNLLRKLIEKSSNTENARMFQKNLMVVLFGGETYDFIGSQRFLFDLKSNQLYRDLNFSNIELMIELNQLTYRRNLSVHFDEVVSSNVSG